MGPSPERAMPAVTPEMAAGGERPAAAPAGGQPAAPKLSAADVAAAIAATPAVGAAPTSASANPATAADVDVIEPEWVDKAEVVIRDHAGDPYGEEEAIEDLQQDYLQKRYGINVADPNPDDTKSKGA